MRLLFTTASASLRLALPDLAEEQIVVGPLLSDQEIEGRIFARRAPAGDYDLAAIVAALPPTQQPDAIACIVDGQTWALPRNLAGCPGRRLLLVGDTQSAPDGLARLVDYARSEGFDHIVFTHGCLDEGIFLAAGLKNVSWFPGLLCPVRDWLLPIIRQPERTRLLSCARENSLRWSALNTRLGVLNRQGVKTMFWCDHAETRLEQMGHSLATLLPSERGEWSPQFFEALAAGSLLVTSGLGPDAGLERLWPDGAPLVAVEEAENLGPALATWQNSPAMVEALRAQGAAWYDRFLGESPRRAAFAALVTEGKAAVPPLALERTGWAGIESGTVRALLPTAAALQLALNAQSQPTAWIAAEAPAAYRTWLRRFPRFAIVPQPQPGCALAIAAAAAPAFSTPFLWSLSPGAVAPGYEPFGSVPGVWAESDFMRSVKAQQEARRCLDLGLYPQALEWAQREVTARPEGPEGHLILADLFSETDSAAGFERHLAVLRRACPQDPRLGELENRRFQGVRLLADRLVRRAWDLYASASPEPALELIAPLAPKAPFLADLHVLRALLLTGRGDHPGALEAWHHVVRHFPNEDELWFTFGLALWQAGRRAEAGFALRRAADHAPHVAAYAQAFARAAAAEPSIPRHDGRERDLVITGSENCQKHGAGVLIKRHFSAHLDTVTLRPATYYQGVEEVGGTHLCLPFQEVPAIELQTRLRRLLAPFKIRRILCIPYHRRECVYALAAQEITRARLCTYVMDDRNVWLPDNDDATLRALFERSALRLAISSELQMAYTIKFDFDFEVMPPTVTNRDARRTNRWNPKVRPPTHAALVGNIWTKDQLVQLVKFVARSGLSLDWYGGKELPESLRECGINLMGFVPESVLADRLPEYPFVVVPSGKLDGTEDNEWLTRLSLPSRIVFLLQTQTPVLVLGSKDTCASRHITHLGIGRVVPYDHPDPIKVINEFTKPAARADYLKNAARAADGFVMPESGRWIWESLDAGTPAPAPFHAVMERVPHFEVLWPPSAVGKIPISHVELASA